MIDDHQFLQAKRPAMVRQERRAVLSHWSVLQRNDVFFYLFSMWVANISIIKKET